MRRPRGALALPVLVVGLVLLLALQVPTVGGVAGAGKRLSKRELEELERAWEDGDAPEELETEDMVKIREYERRRDVLDEKLNAMGHGSTEPTDLQHAQSLAGPSMLFAVLSKKRRPPKAEVSAWAQGMADQFDNALRDMHPVAGQGGEGGWSAEEAAFVTYTWRDVLALAGIDASIYRVGLSAEGHDQMLVTLQKGWDAPQVRDFLLEQREVHSVVWDQQVYRKGKGKKR